MENCAHFALVLWGMPVLRVSVLNWTEDSSSSRVKDNLIMYTKNVYICENVTYC